MYPTLICFHFFLFVRIFYEILMDPAACAVHVIKFKFKDNFTYEHIQTAHVYKHP
jgi:hypothetical protein